MPFRTFDKTCSYKCLLNLKTKSEKKEPRKIVLNKISEKRKNQNRDYSKLRVEFLRSNPFCGVCQQGATEIHHMNGRSNQRLIDTDFFLPVCRYCHKWIHENPESAREWGYLL